MLHFTKTKVNVIIGELKVNGYLEINSALKRGKYSLTEKANAELKKKWAVRRLKNEYEYHAIRG